MKGKSEETNNRSNAIVLTIIALVTMIVVVIGATFAYLAGLVQDNDTAGINATTNATSDLLLIEAGDELVIYADTNNFGENTTDDQIDVANASVILQTSSQTEVSYDYKVYLDITANDFEYSSGKCYETSSTPAIEDVLTYEDCIANNASNLWATTDGSQYACYGATTVNGNYNNQVTCLAASNMWAPVNNAELVMDFYRDDATLTDESTCVAAGRCVDNSRTIDDAYTNSSTCETAGYTWIENIYEDGICYVLDQTADVTTLRPSEDVYEVYDKVTIAATNGTAKQYYKASIRLINFGHNQIINGNKTFNGNLVFERIVTGE